MSNEVQAPDTWLGSFVTVPLRLYFSGEQVVIALGMASVFCLSSITHRCKLYSTLLLASPVTANSFPLFFILLVSYKRGSQTLVSKNILNSLFLNAKFEYMRQSV